MTHVVSLQTTSSNTDGFEKLRERMVYLDRTVNGPKLVSSGKEIIERLRW